jgi:ribosomal protein S18 acetylase RimI-like enzyme
MTYLNDSTTVAIGYCVPEKFTDGTYNLLAIGVAQYSQRKGVAKEMMKYIEQLLKHKDGRILIVETSSDDAQIGARHFYQKIGYTQAAVIKDFWKDGEDKIVFWKKL